MRRACDWLRIGPPGWSGDVLPVMRRAAWGAQHAGEIALAEISSRGIDYATGAMFTLLGLLLVGSG